MKIGVTLQKLYQYHLILIHFLNIKYTHLQIKSWH